MAKSRLFKTLIDLKPEGRDTTIALLNRQLADTFDLYSQTKQAHWNVKGINFFPLHELFDKLAEQVLDYVDLLAERATTLGGIALGTARLSASASRLREYPGEAITGPQHLEALAARYAALAAKAMLAPAALA